MLTQSKISLHSFLTLMLLLLVNCAPVNTNNQPGAAINVAAPAIPDGIVHPNLLNGTSAIDIARENPGYPYAAFRACVLNTGDPDSDQRVYILRNRSNRTVSTEALVLNTGDRNWSVHTLRQAVLAPGESFYLYVTFLPKTTGMHSLKLQVTSHEGSAIVEALSMELTGRGFDCREEVIIEEEIPEPEDDFVPELLDPEPDPGDNADDSTTGGTTTGPTTPPSGPPSVLIRPQDLIPPDQLLECPGLYTEAVSGWDYRRAPQPIQRLRPAKRDVVAAHYANLPTLRATINYVKVPSVANNPVPTQSIRWSNTHIRSEIDRTIRWYAKYCILLTFREVSLRPDDSRQLSAKYDAWLRQLPQDLSMGLSDALSREGDAVLGSAINAAKKVIPSRNEITVLFMDRQVGLVGKRLTQGSFVPTGKNFLGIGLHGADRNDPFILSHELIHAMGLSNKFTWFHSSGDVRSMSRITRRSISDAVGLSESRLLDFAEYKIVKDAGVVR